MTTVNGATIGYNGITIAEVNSGERATLRCAGQQMAGDVVVDVEVSPNLEQQTVTVSGNDTLEVTPTAGYDGLSKVTVVGTIPNGYVQPSGMKTITENGSHDVRDYASVEVAVQGASGDLAINGVIEQYKVNAGATVRAGDFVEFVNKFGSGYFEETALYYVSAATLDEDRVLVAYCFATASNHYSYTRVLTITDGKVTVGAATAIGRSMDLKLVALSSHKAVLVHYDYANSCAAAAVLSVDGDSVTLGTATELEDGQITNISAALLSANKVLVAYQNTGNSGYGTAVVLSVAGNAVTAGTAKVFESAKTSYISIAVLSDSKALVAYTDTANSNYGTAIVLTITGTTIAAGTATVFRQASTYGICAVPLSDSQVLLVYDAYSSDLECGMAIVLQVVDTTITARTPQMFHESPLSNTSAVALSDGKILVAFRAASSTGGYGTARILTTDGTTVTAGEAVVFAEKSIHLPCIAVAGSGSALVVYGKTAGWYTGLTVTGTSIVVESEAGVAVQPATSRLHNVGVAASGGAADATVDVYVVGTASEE